MARDDRTLAEYIRDRQAVRHPSRNRSTTLREYDPEGLCTYCKTEHESFHGHGYTIEYWLRSPQELLICITPAQGQAFVLTRRDTQLWLTTQRWELLEPDLYAGLAADIRCELERCLSAALNVKAEGV